MSWDPNQGQGQGQNPYQPGPYSGYTPPQQPGSPYAGQQGGYQQGSSGPQYGAPPTANAGAPGSSSVGMQPNVAAGLGYLVPIIGLIFFFIEKQSRFVRFHGAQDILLIITSIVWGIVWFVLFFVGAILSAATSSGFFFTAINCLAGLVYLAIGVVWLIAMIQAFMGKTFKIPVIGNLADRMTGSTLTG